MITFTVVGLPAPQGSKRAFRNQHSGRIALVESSKRVAPWRSDVRDAAIKAMTMPAIYKLAGEVLPPLAGPVAIDLAFRFPRPKSHFGSGRNAAALKPTAPIWPSGKPDADKCARAILDALTAIVYIDDAQVVDLGIRKRYADGEGPGVTVTVNALSGRRG